MNDINKALDSIEKILNRTEFTYAKIEMHTKNDSYWIEKDRKNPIGFKVGGNK